MQMTIQKWENPHEDINSELTLDDIFKGYDGEFKAEEYDWGMSAGKEVW